MMMIYCTYSFFFFFFNDTATTDIYTLSLHDALPISPSRRVLRVRRHRESASWLAPPGGSSSSRSEEHTSELQSPDHLVCRLLLEKKKKQCPIQITTSNNTVQTSNISCALNQRLPKPR